MKAILFAILCSILFFVSSCKKDSFINSPDARVSITVDTLKYDTVFATAGSITQSFKIINENNQKLRLSSVRLMGGNSSSYKMNVDGLATTETGDIEIEANDSVYVFVQVNINPGTDNLPFILRDSIQVSYNGIDRIVQLEAWGQNAHFLRDTEISADETWTNDLPYVILGYLYVNENSRLTIDKGCRIYVHAGAPIIIDGSLQVNGGKDSIERVYFRGDRLDDPYKNYPAAWPGLYFRSSSKDNVLNYTVIRNAYQAIIAEDPAPGPDPKLLLNECVIDNAYDAGIIAINTSINAQNCQVTNCGKNISISSGGIYRFTHCTVVSYSNSYINHKDPVLTVANHDANSTPASLDAVFRNCIFWGENGLVDDEIAVSKAGATPFIVNFDHALWKVQNPPVDLNPAPTMIINNQAPEFDSIDIANRYYDFRLKQVSPAIDAGTNAGLLTDLDGKPRAVGIPDLGCFERQP